MNQLGATARDYFQEFLPSRFSELGNPDTFFNQLGEELESQVVRLTPQIAGLDSTEETYLDKLGRLEAARRQATELVLQEMLYDPYPPEEDPEQNETLGIDVAATVHELRETAASAWRADEDNPDEN